MATTINLYTVTEDSRKINKTLPTAINGSTPIQLYLRQDSTNILTPEVSVPFSSAYLAANYAYIPAWNRYYFISDMWVSPAGRLFFGLTVDVLKTYASGILAAQCNVIRSESAGINSVHDTELPLNPDNVDYINTFLPSPFSNDTNYNVCVGIFNSR